MHQRSHKLIRGNRICIRNVRTILRLKSNTPQICRSDRTHMKAHTKLLAQSPDAHYRVSIPNAGNGLVIAQQNSTKDSWDRALENARSCESKRTSTHQGTRCFSNPCLSLIFGYDFGWGMTVNSYRPFEVVPRINWSEVSDCHASSTWILSELRSNICFDKVVIDRAIACDLYDYIQQVTTVNRQCAS